LECEICERKIFDAVVDSHTVNADRKYILCTECFMKWLEKFHKEGLSASMDDVNAWRTKFIKAFKQFYRERIEKVRGVRFVFT